MPGTLIRYWGSYFKNPHPPRQYAAIFERAAARGWCSYLVCCRPPEDPAWLKPLEDAGVTIVYLPRARGNFDFRCVARVFKLCRQLHCDVLHCDNTHTSPLLGAALARVSVRVWSKRSMNVAFEVGRRLTLRDRLVPSVRCSCRLATRTLAVSRAVKSELVTLGIRASRIVVLENPVDHSQADGIDRSVARTNLGMKPGDLLITTVGHAVPVKGWDLLIEAFGRIATEAPQGHLLFVGSTTAGSERAIADGLSKSAQRFGLGGRVHFAGHLLQVEVALAATDIYVQPSRSEGYGLALVEALGAGLPCVATRVGIAPELIHDDVNGFLVDRDDTGQLAEKLSVLIADAAKRQQFSTQLIGAKHALTPEDYAVRLVSLYEALLSPSPGVVGRLLARFRSCEIDDTNPNE